MTEPQISVVGVGKRFVKYEDTPTLIGRIPRPGRTKRSMLWALRGATFDVAPGESVGVIGRNGSGKSTLLRMLAGVTAPTEGRVRIAGRVAPLIAVGVGFHPELTGRENVYVNGTVLGLSREEVDSKFDEIVRFAEIKPFIDTPVKFYSSGMFVRLGFAVSVLADPDVLLVDEVLAVGDINFQLRCFDRMADLQERGTTIVVVSHNLTAVRQMCKRTIVIHDGEMKFDGDTSEAISLYHDLLALPRQGMEDEVDETAPVPLADIAGEVVHYELIGADGQSRKHVNTGETATFSMKVKFDRDVDDPIATFTIYNSAGVRVYRTGTSWRSEHHFKAGETATFDFLLQMWLATDSFTAEMTVINSLGQLLVGLVDPILFYVAGPQDVAGIIDLNAVLTVNGEATSGESQQRHLMADTADLGRGAAREPGIHPPPVAVVEPAGNGTGDADRQVAPPSHP